jgi:OOP family OmpA-OmpF porin
MTRKLSILAILAFLLAAVPSTAFANAYIGAGAGQASTEAEADNVTFDDDTTGWKVYGGFRFLKFLGIEISYVDFGSPESTIGSSTFTADTKAYDGFLVGVLPLGDHFELFAKAGVYYEDVQVTVNNIESGDTDSAPCYGAGAAFIFNEHVALRLEYEMFDSDVFSDLFMYGAGLDFRF